MKYQDIEHFSHHHVLVTLKLDQGEEINCNGCDRLIQEPFHGCLSCNYWLHDDCLNTPRFLQHPSHTHILTLLPTPTYSSRSYSCNACGSAGNAFSFCCAQCEFDLHVHCANLPTTVLLEKHPHELKLIFGSPYEDKSARYVCDLCRGEMLPNDWLYYCPDCDFGTHLDCSMGQPESNAVERGTQATKEENPRARNNRGKTAQRQPRKTTEENQRRSSNEPDTEDSLFEAQRKMRETTIAHKLVLQALDNAADYVGPSSRKYHYY